jgi:hypothetical protein
MIETKCGNCQRTFTPSLRRNGSRQEQRFCSARCRVASHRKRPPDAVRTSVVPVTPELGHAGNSCGATPHGGPLSAVTVLQTPDLSAPKIAVMGARPPLQVTFGGYTVVPDPDEPKMYRKVASDPEDLITFFASLGFRQPSAPLVSRGGPSQLAP